MQVFTGRVGQAVSQVTDRTFIERCAEYYLEEQGRGPGEAELRSWRNSWPPLLDALSSAGLHDLHLLLEYELPGTSQRVDALLLGSTPSERDLVAVAVELKQWTRASPHPTVRGKLIVSEREVLHPSRQVGGYVNYLHDWIPPEVGLQVRGLTYLHNAPASLVDGLNRHAAAGPSAEYPLLGPDDIGSGAAPHAVAARLRCQDLRPADPDRVRQFLDARHRPSVSLLSQVSAQISGDHRFRLIGEQDAARQEIDRAVRNMRGGTSGHIVAVTGGPGTGKTAIACRVFADLCAEPDANPRFLSPSGTLAQQLKRAVGPSAAGLISTLTSSVPKGLSNEDSVVLLDEAHRARTGLGHRRARFPQLFQQLLGQCAVLVVFLDEGQIVRPGEGTTLEELGALAKERGRSFAHVDLREQFRCNGSRSYHDWVDSFLDPRARPSRRRPTAPYEFGTARNPAELESWVADRIAGGHSARITAGFCWPWTRHATPPLPEVAIPWESAEGPQLWRRPWNSGENAERPLPEIPGRAYWATDDGGDQQIGCVYTAQGMEYDYSAVILGDDVCLTPDGWKARPEHSRDPALRGLKPGPYLTYALNAYRVLMTRGARGTRVYSTDPATQQILRSLAP